MNYENCVILADKPVGITSNDVLNIFKRSFGIKKAGHAGTLDPKATGLLLICTGKMTKLMNRFIDFDKQYTGIIRLGAVTESYDTETPEVILNESFEIEQSQLESALKKFTGNILQIPPMYSAIKHKGKPLYKLARKGKTIERLPREILISKFEVKLVSDYNLCFDISCSKGTYIRSIAHDFGAELGVGGYLKELRRVRIGNFNLDGLVEKTEDVKYRIVNDYKLITDTGIISIEEKN